MLQVNSILRSAPDGATIIKGFTRLLGIDGNNSAYLIQLDIDPLQSPFKIPLRELVSEIDEARILTDQEFDCGLPATADQLTAATRKIHEESVAYITKLLEEGGKNMLFDPARRGVVLSKCSIELEISVRTLRRLYYRYLWGGQTEQALVPHFQNRGALGVGQKDGTARRGNKSKDGEHPTCEVSLPMVREKLEKGARLFFLPGNRTLKKAFIKTLKEFFSKDSKFSTISNSKKTTLDEIVLPIEQLPSERQFRYVCNLLELEEGKRTKLPGRVRPLINDQILVGRARDGVRGPGHRFEIDATKLQIKLVSRYGREKIVGNPTLYIIIDCWSGAYVGYALSLHNASWTLAACALHNCFTFKGEVFKRLGLTYDDDDWFCHHLPTNLTADRAELISNKAGNVPKIGITVEVMPPMRPDRKGKVEAAIKDIKHRRSLILPGSYPKFRQRRETDGNDTAALNINELEEIIVDSILGLNNEPVPLSHIPPEMLRDENNDVTHIELYKWGLKHLPGFTRTMEPKMVYSNLLTCASASLTTRGIYYKFQTYKSSRLVNAGYTTNKGRDFIEIRYDEHHADQVWFFDKKHNEWTPALNDNENVRRLKAAFYELESFREDAERLREKAKRENLHQEDERDKKHTHTIQNAKEEAKMAKQGKTKTQNKKKITINKAVETLATDLLDTGRAVTSCVAGLITMKKANTPCDLPEKTKEENTGTIRKQSITQRSKNLWRTNVNLDE